LASFAASLLQRRSWAGCRSGPVFWDYYRVFLLTIVLSFVGFIVLIPAELFEIIILFKTAEMIRSKAADPAVEKFV
jgi:hypothetical protein